MWSFTGPVYMHTPPFGLSFDFCHLSVRRMFIVHSRLVWLCFVVDLVVQSQIKKSRFCCLSTRSVFIRVGL